MHTASTIQWAAFPRLPALSVPTDWRATRPLVVALVICTLVAATLPLASRLAPARSVPVPQAQTSIDALPAAAQATISQTLGADDPAYRVSQTTDALRAANPAHDLAAAFSADGVRIATGADDLGLSLRAVGYGDALRPVMPATLTAADNLVTYRRGSLSEWYANGPLGLEQGFTIQSRPAGESTGQLTLALALSGDFIPTVAADRRSLDLAGPTESLRYAGLFAVDAEGRELPAAIELRAGEILLCVDDAGARYPLLIDPFVQRAKLTASDGLAGDEFGYSAAMTGDTVVVGAYADDGTALNQGSAYVFTRPASGWATRTETAKLTASDGAGGDRFGSSVAITGDTIVVGAYFDDGSAGDQGSAYVFTKPANGWATTTETAKLTASDGLGGDQFGNSVAIAGDTIVVGAHEDDGAAGLSQGSVYVFSKPATGWAGGTETAKLTASDAARGDKLGSSVGIAGDTIVAGAWDDDVRATPTSTLNPAQGSVYVFEKPAGGWAAATESAKLTASDGAPNDALGRSVAITDDTIAAGADGDDTGTGSAYVFSKSSGGWATGTETAKLTASDRRDSDRFGSSVAISGGTIVVGAYLDDADAIADQGSAYVYSKPATGWATATENTKLTAADGAGADSLGRSVAISGGTIVVGAHFDDNSSTDQGSAYVFSDEAPSPASTVSIGNASGGEGDSGTKDLTFTVSRSGTDGASSVDYTVDDGTASSTSDYVDESGTVTFAAGEDSKEITVAVNGDTTDEPDETFTVTLSNASNATIAESGGQGTGTINNDDDPKISIADASVSEGDSSPRELSFTVTRSGDTTGASSVDYVVDDGTASSTSDYVDESGTVTFAANDTSETITVATRNDRVDEPDETLFVNLSNPSNATIADGQGKGTIENDDDARIAIADASVTEGNTGTTELSFTVTRSGDDTTGTSSVDYTVDDGNATAGSDYVDESGTVTFDANDNSETITVTVNGDTTDEPDETLTVNLSNASNASISDNQGKGTITNDDDPGVSIADASVTEGNTGTTELSFTVTRSGDTTGTSTVDYTVHDVTATEDSDYVDESGKVTFAANDTSETITVTVNGDTTDEPDETLVVNLSVPVNATISDASATGTITNDDDPGVSIGDASITEGDTGTAELSFTVTRSGETSSASTLDYTVDDGTATAGSDYVDESGQVNFAAGDTSETITVTVNGDTTDEPDETLTVKLSNGSNASISDASATGTINNNDDPTVSIGDASVTEGHALTTEMSFTVTLSGASAQQVTVAYVVDDGTATAGSDYVDESGTVTFAADDTSETITVSVSGDLTDEPNETFSVKLSTPTNATLSDASGTGTITDDDPGPTFSVADASAGEAGGTMTFTVTKSGLTVNTTSVHYATAAHTAGADPAIAGSDYTATSGNLSFGPTETEKTFTVSITNDTADEPNETFLAKLSMPANATISDGEATGTINDDDEAAAASTIRISDVRGGEAPPSGPSAGSSAFRFTVTRSNASGPASVRYRTSSNSATSPSDYTGVPDGLVRFADGQAQATITISVKDDSMDEHEERFEVYLFQATNATIADAWGIGRIVDDDPAPSLRINDVTVTERDATSYATFTVTLSRTSGKRISVRFASRDGTAKAPGDYTARSAALGFSPGEVTRRVSIAIKGENLRETTEQFFLDLSSPVNATIADSRGVGTIRDDDPDDPLVLLSKTGPAEARPGSVISYTVSYRNLGPFASANARMVDTLPSNVTFYSASGATYDKAKRTVTWRLGTVPTDATGSRTVRVRVNSDLANGTLILNRLDFYGDQTFAAPALVRTTVQR